MASGGSTTRVIVLPSGERFRMSLGPYALAWYDPTLRRGLGDDRRAFHFPSVNEAYLRQGWHVGGIVVAVKSGRLAVHAGGRPVLMDLTPGRVLDLEASVAAGTGIWTLGSARTSTCTSHGVQHRPDGGRIVASAGSKTLDVDLDAGRSANRRIRRRDRGRGGRTPGRPARRPQLALGRT